MRRDYRGRGAAARSGPFWGLVIVLSTYAGFATVFALFVALWVFGGAS